MLDIFNHTPEKAPSLPPEHAEVAYERLQELDIAVQAVIQATGGQ